MLDEPILHYRILQTSQTFLAGQFWFSDARLPYHLSSSCRCAQLETGLYVPCIVLIYIYKLSILIFFLCIYDICIYIYFISLMHRQNTLWRLSGFRDVWSWNQKKKVAEGRISNFFVLHKMLERRSWCILSGEQFSKSDMVPSARTHTHTHTPMSLPMSFCFTPNWQQRQAWSHHVWPRWTDLYTIFCSRFDLDFPMILTLSPVEPSERFIKWIGGHRAAQVRVLCAWLDCGATISFWFAPELPPEILDTKKSENFTAVWPLEFWKRSQVVAFCLLPCHLVQLFSTSDLAMFFLNQDTLDETGPFSWLIDW